MTTFLRTVAVLAALSLAGVQITNAADAKANEAKPRKKPVVLVVAEAASVDGVEPRPSADRPIHYIIGGAMERPLGGMVGLHMPSREEVEASVVSTLAKEGFVRTEVGGPLPSIVLFISWGEARLESWEYQETDPTTGDTQSFTGAYNREEIAKLVGADKAKSSFRSNEAAETLNSAARANRLYIVVAAMDAQKLRKGEKSLVWRVRMSIPDDRTSLIKSMSVLLESGGPMFGRNFDEPVFVDEKRRRTKVEFGELKVIEDDSGEPER
jgi:hypothetical protein